jgi:hypothetical protein
LEVARILRDVLPENRTEADKETLREAEAQNTQMQIAALRDAADHPEDSQSPGSDPPDSDLAGSDVPAAADSASEPPPAD